MPDEVARVAANTVARHAAFNETALYLRTRRTACSKAAASIGSVPRVRRAGARQAASRLRVVRGLLREEFRRGQCYFIDHRVYAMSDEETFFFPNGPRARRGEGYFHADDALFVPLYDHDNELIGLFDVYDPSDGRLPGEETFQLLEVFATVTASALENARYDAELRQLAVSDGLTGLFNHRHFQETLVVEVERRAALRARVHPAHDGPGPLQERQRPPRSPARRRGAARPWPPCCAPTRAPPTSWRGTAARSSS